MPFHRPLSPFIGRGVERREEKRVSRNVRPSNLLRCPTRCLIIPSLLFRLSFTLRAGCDWDAGLVSPEMGLREGCLYVRRSYAAGHPHALSGLLSEYSRRIVPKSSQRWSIESDSISHRIVLPRHFFNKLLRNCSEHRRNIFRRRSRRLLSDLRPTIL